MRAVIRLRSGINAKPNIKETLKYLRLNKINHCVLVPDGETYDGMLKKVKDYVTWGELKPEVLTNMMIKRGRLTGNRPFDNNYIKTHTNSDSMIKFAQAIISGKERYADLKDVQPVFRLHPPVKGLNAVKKSFKAGGDLGYRGQEINDLILRMLGPKKKEEPKMPGKKKAVAKKKAPVKKKAPAKKKPATKKKSTKKEGE